MHGGINDTIGYIPGTDSTIVTLETWITKLNKFKDDQLKEFYVKDQNSDKDIEVNKDDNVCLNSKKRKAHQLIELGVPGGNGGHTVI